MKKMLMAATVVGSAIAGILLYASRRENINNHGSASKRTFKAINGEREKIDRPGHHSMG